MQSSQSTSADTHLVTPLAAAPMVAPDLVLSDYSRFVQRIRRRYGAQLLLLPAGVPLRESMQIAFLALQAEGLALGAALRVLRQLVMERLVVLDCDGDADSRVALAVVTRAMT